MKKAFVFIESNTTTGELFFKATLKKSIIPILLTSGKTPYHFKLLHKLKVIKVDTTNERELCKTIQSLKDKYEILSISSSSDYFIEIASQLSKKFGFCGPNPDSIRNCRNKFTQLEILNASHIAVPQYYLVTNMKEALIALKKQRLPVIIKPVSGSGSIGVRLCSSLKQAKDHIYFLLSTNKNERGITAPNNVLVQEFINGPEYSVESFGKQIIGITKKYVSSPPVFIETGHDFPDSTLSHEINIKLKQIVTAAINALDLTWGPIHTELKIINEQPVIIEVNPRLAGGFIPELIRYSTGVDIIEQLILACLGRSVKLNKKKSNFSSIRFFIPQVPGIFENVNNISIVKTMSDFKDLKMYKKRGENLKISGDFRDRIGHLIFSGRDEEEIKLKMENAIKKLNIIIK